MSARSDKRGLHAAAGFEHHQRGVDPRKLGQPCSARGLLRRQESFEEEPVGRQCCHRECGQHRGRARQRDHVMSRRADLAHQLEAGIGNQGRAGIRDQRDRSALRQPFQDFRPRQRGVMFVIGLEQGRDRVALGEPAGDAGILAGDDVDAGQRLQRAQGDVAEIADRGRHQMQAGPGLGRGQDLAGHGEGTGCGFRQAFNRIGGGSFWAHNADLERTRRLRHTAGVTEARQAQRRGNRDLQPAPAPQRHNPFVLVNYSPTICLNPPS